MSKDIIGISIGSKNTVIGTYKNGIFQVILSDTSSRTIPTVISFSDKERTFGDIAFNKNRTNFKTTIIYPNRWLGLKQEYSIFEEEVKYANLSPKTINYEGKNFLGFFINSKGNKIFYLPETIMGSFLNKIKMIWLNNNINTNNIVLSVPDYYTIQERQSLLDSAYISNINCTAILNESSAISLNYAFQKMKEFDNNKPRTIVFIDYGHSKLTIFYAEFSKTSVNIISVSSERFCGARELDYLIAEKISYEFQKKHGVDLMDLPKAKISLMNAINKVRKTLTVNTEGIISIDEIIKGKDLVYNLTREKMEEMIKPSLIKFENFCNNSLIKAKQMGLDINNIHSVEMVGDTLRSPCLLKIIKNVFKKDLSKTLIPDECISRGCTLFAMMNSVHYKIQNFSIKHYNPYNIILECEDYFYQLFTEGENFPVNKKVNIKIDLSKLNNELIIRAGYSYAKELNFLSDKSIQEYKLNLPFINNKAKIKNINFELEYNLDINCIPKLIHVLMIENNCNKEINFELIRKNFGLPNDYLDILKKEEIERENRDLNIKEAINFKNSLEDDIYKARDKIISKGELYGYYTNKEKEKLINEIDKLMKWLYSEDDDLYNLIKLKEKSSEMKSILDKIYLRYNEWQKLKNKFFEIKSLFHEKARICISLEDKIKNGEKTDINMNTLIKIKQLLEKEYDNLDIKIHEVDKEYKYYMPSITADDLQDIMNKMDKNIEQIKSGKI